MSYKGSRMLYSVRPAKASDAVAINVVSQYLGYVELPETEVEAKLVQLLNSATDEVYVAEYQGVVIGWLHLFFARRLASPDFYEIGGLVVTPVYRGQGVGRFLVEHVVANHNGKVRVRCNEKRVESHQFYEATGFSSEKVQRIFEARS